MSTDLVQRAAAGKLEPAYIISSDQPLLVDRAVRAIVDAAISPEMRGFNYDVIETKGATATRIVTACQTLPMMADRRVVLVRDLAIMPAAELMKLLPYLDSPNPSTVLIALTSKLDKRLKFYQKVTKKKKLVHELKAPGKLVPWIRDEADSQGIVFERGATERLADVIGKDLARLSLAMSQLALYVSTEAADRPITVDDIDDLIADTRERSVFELTDAISHGNRVAALTAIGSLCDQRQSAVGVVVMLARHIRSLGMCHVAKQRRLSRDGDIARVVGAPAWKVRKLMAESHRYPPLFVGRALAKLSEADRELKGQTSLVKVLGRELGERVILDRVVSDIMDLRQNPRRGGPSRRRR